MPTLGAADDHCHRGMTGTLDELQASLFDVGYALTAGEALSPETFAELRGVLTTLRVDTDLLAQQLDTFEHLVRFDRQQRAAVAAVSGADELPDDRPETDGGIHGHLRPEVYLGLDVDVDVDDATGRRVAESPAPEPPVFPL